ncbi:hypothetical protein LEM8419_03213 [Neolewinella maritima]|uniref:Glycosyltransferase 2-like domain-containing protein n=1 Tax=Neolewinella maritima TaxID=1383882 RepID=A0ABN8FD94_9BACT|nr:glycosyltransferase family 2 protein [Neolewinella maritima]CAH1002293.1 hypothetical protein LEM8419_03213 [Neolewinella maritima]
MPQASVIVSTYNSPAWLEKVLWGFEVQTRTDFELIIADDGSGSETRQFIERYRKSSALDIQWVWHEDAGFRKTEILNKAIAAARADYLVFTDGDCIPRQDFVATHLRLRRPNSFLSGGYYKLPRSLSEQLTQADVASQRCFTAGWLRRRGKPTSIKDLKLIQSPRAARLLNRLTPTRPSWNGHNASTWTRHVLDANGFDTRMKYGGEDREFGDRLLNAGLHPVQIRYAAVCLHLDHDRGYVTPGMVAANRLIWDETRRSGSTRTPFGLVQT